MTTLHKILVLSLLIGSLGQSTAQNITDYIHNGVVNDSKWVLDNLESQYPGYRDAVDATFDNAHNFSTKSGGTKVINLVIHVVWKDSTENLPDSVIYNQLDILNNLYLNNNFR